MPTIVVASPKGGVGKSTTANLLMTCLARRGASVSGIDADRNRPQVKWALRAGIRILPERSGHEPKTLLNLTIIEKTGEESLIKTIQAAAAPSAKPTWSSFRAGHPIWTPLRPPPCCVSFRTAK